MFGTRPPHPHPNGWTTPPPNSRTEDSLLKWRTRAYTRTYPPAYSLSLDGTPPLPHTRIHTNIHIHTYTHFALVEGQHRDTPLACTVGLTKWGATRPEDAGVARQAQPGDLVKVVTPLLWRARTHTHTYYGGPGPMRVSLFNVVLPPPPPHTYTYTQGKGCSNCLTQSRIGVQS